MALSGGSAARCAAWLMVVLGALPASGLLSAEAPAQSIRGALRAYTARHCSVESVVEHSGLYATPNLVKAKAWLSYVLGSSDIRVVWRRSNAVRAQGEFEYRRNGHLYHVWWDDFLAPDAPVRRRLVIRACMFAPTRLEIFDTDLASAGTSARVIYMPKLGYSWVGQQLLHIGLLTGNNSFPSPNGMAHVGWLTEAQNGDWRVDGVD